MNHKITPEIDRMIADHYLQHRNAPLLSCETGISKSAIYSSLRRQGIQRERQGARPDMEKERRIVELFQELKSTRLVSDRMGIPLNRIHYALKKAQIETPRIGRRHNPYAACDVNAEKVLKMCEDGCSLSEIGEAVGTKGEEVKKFLRRHGINKEFPKATYGERHYAWKGRLIDKNGYVMIHCKGHPNARKHTHYIFEHRLVMEDSLGRFLLPTEVVHHINGVKNDNRIENLQLFDSNGEHLAHELKGRCPNWTKEGKQSIRRANHQRWLAWRAANPLQLKGDDQPCI
jgi:hypothetical protein